jgi:hypothetical protein
VRTERAHLETVRAIAFTEGISDAIASGDSQRVQALAQPIAANSATERIVVLDSSGQTLVSLALSSPADLTYEPSSTTGIEGEWPIAQAVLNGITDELGDKQAQIIETDDGFVLYAAAPIESGSEVIGVVLAGTTLETFLIGAEEQALADISLYDFDGTSLASTFVAEPGDEDADLTINDLTLLTSITSGETVREWSGDAPTISCTPRWSCAEERRASTLLRFQRTSSSAPVTRHGRRWPSSSASASLLCSASGSSWRAHSQAPYSASREQRLASSPKRSIR